MLEKSSSYISDIQQTIYCLCSFLMICTYGHRCQNLLSSAFQSFTIPLALDITLVSIAQDCNDPFPTVGGLSLFIMQAFRLYVLAQSFLLLEWTMLDACIIRANLLHEGNRDGNGSVHRLAVQITCLTHWEPAIIVPLAICPWLLVQTWLYILYMNFVIV